MSETLAEFAAVGDDKGGLNAVFYNVVHPHTFSWEDLLGELRICGLNFVSKPFNDWLQMLRESAAQEDEAQNPAVKLLGYFENTYGAEEGFEGEGIRFETTAARRDSSALRAAPKVVESGLVRKFLDQWLERWGR